MKKLIILSLMAIGLTACGDKDEQQPQTVQSAKAEAEILSYVPADTPFIFFLRFE
jgi:hypothetical protein